MSEKSDKKRYSVTLTTAYREAIERLIWLGVYLDPQDVIRDFMRRGFQLYGLEPFTAPEKPEEPR